HRFFQGGFGLHLRSFVTTTKPKSSLIHNLKSVPLALTPDTVPVRRWWWTDKSGTVMVALRRGNRVVELGEGKQSVEVGPIEKLPDVLRTLREAAIAGELDEQLKPTPFGRPLPKKGGKV